MRVLVTYATETGCTAGVAEAIGRTLAEEGVTSDVKPMDAADDVSSYDAVIAGSGVRMASWHKRASYWVIDHAEALKRKPVVLFTVGLQLVAGAKVREVRAYTDPLITESGIMPIDVAVFGGCNDPRRFTLGERVVLGMQRAPKGDFRDWDAISTWTRRIAAQLQEALQPAPT